MRDCSYKQQAQRSVLQPSAGGAHAHPCAEHAPWQLRKVQSDTV